MESRRHRLGADVSRTGGRGVDPKLRFRSIRWRQRAHRSAQPNERLTVNLYETFKLPISGAVADFNIAPLDDGTELTLHYSYTPNLLGRVMKGYTDKQMRKGISGLAKGLQQESERVATS